MASTRRPHRDRRPKGPDSASAIRDMAIVFAAVPSTVHVTVTGALRTLRLLGLAEGALASYRDPRQSSAMDLTMTWLTLSLSPLRRSGNEAGRARFPRRRALRLIGSPWSSGQGASRVRTPRWCIRSTISTKPSASFAVTVAAWDHRRDRERQLLHAEAGRSDAVTLQLSMKFLYSRPLTRLDFLWGSVPR